MEEDRERNEGGRRRRTGEDEAEEIEEDSRLCFNYICLVFRFGVGWKNFYFSLPLVSLVLTAKFSLFIINFALITYFLFL